VVLNLVTVQVDHREAQVVDAPNQFAELAERLLAQSVLPCLMTALAHIADGDVSGRERLQRVGSTHSPKLEAAIQRNF